jgi:tRNA (cmo5U34)-methyltransferase
MTQQTAPEELFNKQAARSYNARNHKISAINDNLHLLIRLVLKDLPEQAKILCVGIGTGNDIFALAEEYPEWKFLGVDPSEDMLDVCQSRILENDLQSRCALVQGYLSDIPETEPFDTVLCLLVTHFITDATERQALFSDMAQRLKPGGCLINADISGDPSAPHFPSMLEAWKNMHRYTGASEEKIEGMLKAIREHVAILPPATIEGFLRQAGLPLPVLFFQSLLIHAWYSQKPREEMPFSE